jgi:hypothetical protein
MSEEKESYMQQLDAWTDEVVVNPLLRPHFLEEDLEQGLADCDKEITQVKRAIRQKVLESYRNGQAAGPAKPRVGTGSGRKELSHVQAKNR